MNWFCLLVGGVLAQPPCIQSYELSGYAGWPGGWIELLPGGIQEEIDSMGYFHIHHLCPGEYRLRVWLGGHIVAETTAKVPSEVPLWIEGKEKLHEVVIEERLSRTSRVAPLMRLKRPEGTLAAHIEEIPGVSLSQAGPLLQKPILEGLRGTRVAYAQGGVLLSSQQWGEEHAPEIDPFSAEEVEVHLGPSPVRYGTEAVGGAIVLPVPSLCCLRPVEGSLLVGGLTNGRGGVFSGRLQGTLYEWGYRLQGTLLRMGTFRAPSYFLTGSGSYQLHGSAMLQRLWPTWQLRLYYAQYNAQIGLFQGMHVGNLTDLQRAIASAQPLVYSDFSYKLTAPLQVLSHELISFSLSRLLLKGGLLTLQLSRQYNRRQEKDAVGLYTGSGGIGLDLQLTTHSAQLSYESGGFLLAGFLHHQRNYRQYAYFIPTYERWQGGAYFLFRKADWEVGARIEPLQYVFHGGIWLDTGFTRESIRCFFPSSGVEATKEILLSGGQRLRWLAAFLLRAPNPAELYAYGYHQAQGAFEIGKNTLRGEPTTCLRTTYIRKDGEYALSLYYSPAFIWTRLGDPILSLRGASLALYHEQSPAVWINLSGKLQHLLDRSFLIEIRGSYLWGSLLSAGWRPLPLLPGPLLTPTLRWHRKEWMFSISWSHHFRQTRYDLTAEYLPPPKGYGLLGAELHYQRGRWHCLLAGENLLNHRYRAYPDLMRFFADQIGRQIKLVVEYSFSSRAPSR
ncbi:MAG: TonB-dependent receptor plug domain-containing protein [Bacteroidia bacterium]|nr:TonB-dependent receptor plug domain-containing protein [Bacteroidia bacterium]